MVLVINRAVQIEKDGLKFGEVEGHLPEFNGSKRRIVDVAPPIQPRQIRGYIPAATYQRRRGCNDRIEAAIPIAAVGRRSCEVDRWGGYVLGQPDPQKHLHPKRC